MAKASLTIAIGGEYDGRAIERAQKDIRELNLATAREIGGITGTVTGAGDSMVTLGSQISASGGSIEKSGKRLMGVTAIIAGAGAAAVKAAQDVEAGANAVKTATGLTGDAAEELIEDYEAAAGNVVGSFEDIGSAAGELNTRFGLTGEALQKATEQTAKYAKVTGEDATMAVKDVASMMNNAQIPVSQYGHVLDVLTVAGQQSGISVGELAKSVTANAAQMREMGFSTEESIAMLASFEKSGANTASILSAMKKGVSNWVKEGKDAGREFAAFVEGVEDGSVTAADAIEIFGSKGGVALYDAAKQGQLDFKDMFEAITDGSDGALDDIYEDTLTIQDKIDILAKKAELAASEIGEAIVDTVIPMVDDLSEKVSEAAKWFKGLSEEEKQNIVKMGAMVAAAGPLLVVIGKVGKGIGSVVSVMGKGLQTVGAFSAAMHTVNTESIAAGNGAMTFGQKVSGAAQKTGILTKASNLLKGGLAGLGIGAAVAVVGLLVNAYAKWKEHNDMVVKATQGLESAVGAAKTAYDEYKGSVDNAATSMANVKTSAEEALKAQADLADSMTSKFKDVGTNSALVEHYADTIAELGNKGSLTDTEIETLKTAVGQFNELTGAGVTIIDENTGALDRSTTAIQNVAAAYAEEARQAAAREMMVEVSNQIIENELAMQAAQDELTAAEEAYQTALKQYPAYAQSASQAVQDAKKRVDELSSSQVSAKKTLGDLTEMAAQTPTYFTTMEGAFDSVGLSVSDFGDLTEDQLSALETSFDGSLTSIYNTCQDTGIAIPSALADGIENNAYKATDQAANMATDVADAASGADMYSAGYNAAVGFQNGYGSVDLYGYASNVANNFLTSFKNALGIQSPSKKFAEAGRYTVQGAIVGMRSMEGALDSEVAKLSDIVTLEPTVGGTWAMTGGASGSGFGGFGGSAPTINVYITPQAGASNSEIGRMAGREIADALYVEVMRQEASRLWRS
ncbi:MAG: phage tail tape measure protein [Eggerthellaceae bacterium]|nr:phage tail tape measure protein [Eggerthellaceae bacterium]